MKSKKTPVPAAKPELSSRPRRFRIAKLEERVAPRKGGKGTHNCWTGICTDYGGGSFY